MKRKFISIGSSLLGVALGLAYSAISANAETLRPYVPLAWIVVVVGAILSVFFIVADDIKFKYLSLYFQKSRLSQFKASIDSLEAQLVHDPELEDVKADEVLNRLKSWEDIGDDLIVMSRTYTNAKHQIVDLTSLIALAMLRYRREKKFIHLGKTAYKRAKRLKRWNKAVLIAYYITHAYYSLNANLNTNDGQKWVGRMKQIYNKSPHEELQALLLEVEGLRLKDNSDERPNAKRSFEEAIRLSRKPDLANKHSIVRMRKNIYFYLADLAERESDNNTALSFYNEALDPSSRDVFKQLYIYGKLGQLALLIKNYDQAYQYYDNQLDLAEMELFPVSQSSAHKGLAKTLLKRNPPDIENAYLHAKKALEIVKEYSEDKTEEYEIQTIMIDIANKLFEEYYALHHGQQII